MSDEWPEVSERVRDLFQAGAEAVLASLGQYVAQLSDATLLGISARTATSDPALIDAQRRATAANLRQWAAANVRHPAKRVVPEIGAEQLAVSRDLVRRGLDESALDSYRTSQSEAWRLWMHVCFSLTSDPEELRELLDISALSISTFMDGLMEAITDRIQKDRRELTRGTHAERMAAVSLILEGAPIGRDRAESQLGYGLSGAHTATVIWADGISTSPKKGGLSDRIPRQLEAAADALIQAAGVSRRLTIIASPSVFWVWLPTGDPVDREALNEAMASIPDVRVAIGRAGEDLPGFRSSHLDATTTQRFLARVTGTQQVSHFQDVQLVNLASTDLVRANEFVADTLGALATADVETREVVRTYIRLQSNTSETARQLFTHRNSVIRRLARADELLPRPLAERVVEVAVALEILRTQDSAAV